MLTCKHAVFRNLLVKVPVLVTVLLHHNLIGRAMANTLTQQDVC
jgi:hypothetical protein